MTLTRIILAILAIGLSVLIYFAALEAPIGESFGRITQDLWGWTALVDLYLGFVMIAVIIAVFERNPLIAAVWIVPTFLLGNAWAAFWLVWRLPKIVAHFRH